MNVAHDMESWKEAFSEPKQKFCHDSLRSQQMTLNIVARPIRHSKKNTDIVHARIARRKLHDDDDAMKTEPVVHDAHGGGMTTSDRSSALHVKTTTCMDHVLSHRSHQVHMTLDQEH